MAQAENGMVPEHARAGIAHDGADLFAAGRLVAVDGTLDTDGLLRAKTASFQPQGRIIQQGLAFGAKGGPGGVMVAAVAANHGGNGLPLAGQARARQGQGEDLAVCRRRPQVGGLADFHRGHRERDVRPGASAAP
jgi:hypothetical protein